MPVWLTTVLAILGLADKMAPLIEQLLAGFAVFIATIAKQIWGDAAAAEVTNVLDAAERIVAEVTIDADAALKFVTQLFPTLAELEQAMPGTAQAIMAKHLVMADTGAPHAIAAKVVEAAVANVRVKAAANVQ